jgi:flagellar hook-associated protein 3 FlgL
MDSNDTALNSSQFSITGSADKTLLVRFTVAGAPTTATLGSGNVSYEYSDDGGKTFKAAQAIPASGSTVTLSLGGVSLTLDGSKSATEYDPANPGSTAAGSWLWVRPTAEYVGDDKDLAGTEVDGIITSATAAASTLTGTFSGSPGGSVLVRVDQGTAFNGPIKYSYSLDNGSNWTTGNTVNNAAATTSVDLVVPGGVLTLNSSVNPGVVNPGDEFAIRPRTADVDLEISAGQKIAINNIGKDIFGGVYQDPSSTSPSAVFGGAGKNVFESLGKLVSALETNNQPGVQQSLGDLKEAAQTVLTAQATVGGRENRLTIADAVLAGLKDNDTERMSKIEDADLTELMTKLANQQLAYQAVLKSTSMVMQMSLMQYMG